MGGPWNGWYHVTGGTYGAWLPGDPRGWRSRHHREHVEGDYRTPPPPGLYEGLRAASQANMGRDPVRLTADQRQLAGRALVEMLVHQGVEVAALSIDAVHFHVLGRFCYAPARTTVGKAKQHAWHLLRAAGQAGKLWAQRGRTLAIRSEAHWERAREYLLAHGQKGAWIWQSEQGIYWTPTAQDRQR